MSNIASPIKFGAPSVGLTWPKHAKVEVYAHKLPEGRWQCRVVMNGEKIILPGTHPTEADAKLTLEGYIAEQREKQPTIQLLT